MSVVPIFDPESNKIGKDIDTPIYGYPDELIMPGRWGDSIFQLPGYSIEGIEIEAKSLPRITHKWMNMFTLIPLFDSDGRFHRFISGTRGCFNIHHIIHREHVQRGRYNLDLLGKLYPFNDLPTTPVIGRRIRTLNPDHPMNLIVLDSDFHRKIHEPPQEVFDRHKEEWHALKRRGSQISLSAFLNKLTKEGKYKPWDDRYDLSLYMLSIFINGVRIVDHEFNRLERSFEWGPYSHQRKDIIHAYRVLRNNFPNQHAQFMEALRDCYNQQEALH